MTAADTMTPSEASQHRAPLITLVSASGGVGKSTLALLLAHLAASEGIETALVEGDLQFGDMGFWLGLDIGSSSLASGASCEPVAISNHLDLYKAPVLPELAEEVSESVAWLVGHVQTKRQLVVADTGQFWSGLTGELLCTSDLVVLMMDQRKSSVFGAIKALELCRRLNVPDARIIRVANRMGSTPRSEIERMRALLDCDELHMIADGKGAVESLVGTGRIEELVESDRAPVPDVSILLSAMLRRVGLEFSQHPRKKARRLFS